MTNLLPNKDITALKKLYWLRFTAIAFTMAALLLVVGTVLLLPSYILLLGQTNAYSETFLETEREQQDVSLLMSAIRDANALATEIESNKNELSFFETLQAVRVLGGDAISIDTFFYEYKKNLNEPDQILLYGVAKDRASLTQFSRAVQSDERFSEAIVPIQNLAGDKDVAFTITAVLAPADTQ